MIFRPYQQAGITDIFREWELHDIILFVLATGGGKTVIFSEVIRRLLAQGKRGIMVAHREELISQGAATMVKLGLDAGVVMAASPVNLSKPLQVCSVQTLARRPQFFQQFKADFIIFDEGHHVTDSNTYGSIIAKYPEAKVLIVTATPYRLSGDGFEYLHKWKKTKLILNRTLPELIDEGWLVPIKYFAASIPDLSGIKIKGGDYVEEEAARAMELAPLVDSYLEHAKGLQGICFTVNIAHSIKTVQQYLYAGIPAEHIDANTPKEVRRRILGDFRAGLVKVISNVGIITEGSDFPGADFVQHASPTKSLSLACQKTGRVTRTLPGLVDDPNLTTAEARRAAIAASSKPYGIVLDNAGLWLEPEIGLPTRAIDWQAHFIGRKKLKKEAVTEMMEMLVYVAEDEEGTRVRSSVPEEVEGLRLVEITSEPIPPKFDQGILAEFDKRYYSTLADFKGQKVGYQVYYYFKKKAEQKNILLTQAFWDHIKKRIVDEPDAKMQALKEKYQANFKTFDPALFRAEMDKLEKSAVPLNFWKREFYEYELKNRLRLAAERFS